MIDWIDIIGAVLTLLAMFILLALFAEWINGAYDAPTITDEEIEEEIDHLAACQTDTYKGIDRSTNLTWWRSRDES